MIGILIQLLLSWLLLWFFQKKGLKVLGFKPTKLTLMQFCVGLLLPVIYYGLFFMWQAYLGNNPYHLNHNYTLSNLLQGLWYLFKSVAFETLIFNGALLYILAKRIGAAKAALISAVAFGIYHWFSWNLFGQPVTMAIVFVSTGVVGYLWSLAYVRTVSIWLPFALHYGVDFTFNILLSKDRSMGEQLFVQTYTTDPHNPGIVLSVLAVVFYYAGFPLLMWLYLSRLKRRNTSTSIVF